jgi:peptidoglycan/LPS O-acetylase OafA/YrhL
MLRRTDPSAPIGWGMPHPALQRPAGRITERTRWLWLVPLVVGFLTVFGWVASHDPGKGLALSNRGWLTIAAAAVLLVLLSVHRNDGFGHLVRMVAEYAVVAVLCVLLATAAAGGQHAQGTTARAQAGPGAGCPPVLQVRAWLTCLWHQASEASKADQQAQGNSR